MLRQIFFGALVGTIAFAFVGCDVEKVDEGEMPTVDVQGDPGELPEYDVDTADVDVEWEERKVTVPDVDVGTEEAEVKVPDVDIDPPGGQ